MVLCLVQVPDRILIESKIKCIVTLKMHSVCYSEHSQVSWLYVGVHNEQVITELIVFKNLTNKLY